MRALAGGPRGARLSLGAAAPCAYHGDMAKQANKSADDASEEPGFDARLTELEAIVAELEDGELSLEDAIERYGAGVQLLRRCHAQLGEYRARVEELSREAEGALSAFDEDPDLPGDPAEA